MRVTASVASITDDLGAHAIVNASNPDVALGSGVSGAIREACGGAAFQSEVRQRLENEFDAPLEEDDCLCTSAGVATAFRWVLHVPAVNYRKPDPETGGPSGPTRIFRCMAAAIREADQLAASNGLSGRFVLAAPLLGAGHGGVGEVASADAMMRAIRESCFAQRCGLAEIRFVVMQEHLARLVAQAADRHGVPFGGAAGPA